MGNAPSKKRRRGSALAVDAKKLAAMLTASVRTIRTWDAAGKLPAAVKVGGRTLWYLPEIQAWLRAGAPDRAAWDAIKAARKS